MSAGKLIRISDETRRQLHDLRDVSESYDAIRSLVVGHNRCELFERIQPSDVADEFVLLREAVDE